MPRFEPFRGIRYRAADLSALIAPPYDVISDEQRQALEAADPHNVVRLELPQEAPGMDRYTAARQRLVSWLRNGVLAVDAEPALYRYRMRFSDELGQPRATTGVIGALGLERPGAGDILPHERTTPKAKSDRAELLWVTTTNTSPVWGLSLAAGLSDRLGPQDAPPPVSATDTDGVVHELWPVTDAPAIADITATVASAPIVIADGHHRYEVALGLQAQRLADGSALGPWDGVMAFVVELAEDQIRVEAIHRLITGLTSEADLLRLVERWFVVTPTAPPDAGITTRMDDRGSMTLLTQNGTWWLDPLPALVAAAPQDLDSSRLEVILAEVPALQVSYQHGVENVVAAVANGTAQAGVLLRPAAVGQIAAVARARERMPPKTTFFTPKPATGLVLRSIGDHR